VTRTATCRCRSGRICSERCRANRRLADHRAFDRLSSSASVGKLLKFSTFVAPEFCARVTDLRDCAFPLPDRLPHGCSGDPSTSKFHTIDDLDKTQPIRSGIRVEQLQRGLSAPKKRTTRCASSKRQIRDVNAKWSS
jgi:hypothetical protein